MKRALLSLATLVGLISFAQTSYTLSTYTSAYTELTAPTIIAVNDVDEDTWDEPVFVVPFGFDFQLDGETYDFTFQWGSGAMMGFGGFNIQDSTLTDPLIHTFGLFSDLIDGDHIEGLPPSEISFQVQGAVGDRIAKIQYKDAAFYYEGATANNRINFQIWFYEDDGIMEIHFGGSNIPDPTLVYNGFPGPLLALLIDFNINDEEVSYNGIIYGDPADPSFTEVVVGGNDEPATLDATPASGRVYRLAPGQANGVIDTPAPQISIYPTLVDNAIRVESDMFASATYRIVDIAGKKVQTGQVQIGDPIHVPALHPGPYVLSVDGMGGAVRFVKQ
ncbi:MAG: T9SS type A sorting domain-containing protein [Flavobacteriales bacterium]|nr:T9SS type A sorting domain-containing protein [Flavobacteriales bacterium]